MRRLLARRNSTLLRDLRGRPARFWAGFKADGRAAPGGGFTLQEIGAHWGAVLGGAGRGALEEGPAGDPGALAAALEAAAARADLTPERRAAAAALSAPISVAEVTAGFHDGRCAADAAFVLRHLIDRARLSPAQPRRRLFAAFIDLEKAYDNVPRIRLVELLASRAHAGLWRSLRAAMLSAAWELRTRRTATGAQFAPADMCRDFVGTVRRLVRADWLRATADITDLPGVQASWFPAEERRQPFTVADFERRWCPGSVVAHVVHGQAGRPARLDLRLGAPSGLDLA
ncbi:MAG: hypothetical protein J3K34DRAFT_475068 [Monoraphidium minutum]|nr:MAG: hypothetical protein J3K34DRAFT_475068 [Monoraphidium minutum]